MSVEGEYKKRKVREANERQIQERRLQKEAEEKLAAEKAERISEKKKDRAFEVFLVLLGWALGVASMLVFQHFGL